MNRQPGKEPGIAELEAARGAIGALEAALGSAVVGQEAAVRELVTAVVAGGHVLLEGLPGLGKTHLVKALANALGLSLARIQCTPDLMPADITGSEVLTNTPDGGLRALDFRPGPIFAPLVLVDEINRAMPKTQAALLEAMQEGQVTWGGRSHALPTPFRVVATQNPIEVEGTYPLPEAQLDRFLFKTRVPYPEPEALLRMAHLSLDREPADAVAPVLPAGRLAALQEACRTVIVGAGLARAAVDLVLATHGEHPAGTAGARTHIRYGASPRGLQALLRAGRVRALAAGRLHLALEDLRTVALPALRHRVLLRLESELEGVRVDALLTEIIAAWLARH